MKKVPREGQQVAAVSASSWQKANRTSASQLQARRPLGSKATRTVQERDANARVLDCHPSAELRQACDELRLCLMNPKRGLPVDRVFKSLKR